MQQLTKRFYVPRFKDKIRFTGRIPKTFVDDFQIYDYKQFSLISSIFFLITVFFLPIVYDLLGKYVIGSSQIVTLGMPILKFIGYAFSFGWFLYEDAKKFIKSGAWAIYLFFAAQIIIGIAGAVVSSIGIAAGWVPNAANLEGEALNVALTEALGGVLLFVQGIIQIGVVILILLLSKPLMLKIFNTITYNILLVILTLIFAYAIFYGLSSLSSLINTLINGKGETSQNQKLIERVIRSSTTNKILAFIPIVIAAPLLEELALRHSFIMLTRNRWIGASTSVILFVFIHIGSDPNTFFVYFGMSLAFTGVFIVSRENVAYSILLHALGNFIAYIILISK